MVPMMGCDKAEVSSSTMSSVDLLETQDAEVDAEEDAEMSSRELPTLEDDVLGIALDGFFPEGITRSDEGDFYIGSVNTGTIVVVRRGQQWAQELISGARLEGAGTAGLIADSARGSLWACTGDFFGQIPSKIWRFDLLTGETQAQYTLPGRSFCNDLALDDQGRVYATDSFGGRIMRIDDQMLEVWLEGTEYEPVNSPLSLNGITWDPQGKIWFGRSDTGQLSSVVINPDGSPGYVQADQLTLPEDMTPLGIDGLKWRSNDELIAIRGREVYQLVRRFDSESEADWETNLLDATLNHATTFAFDEPKDAVWVVESQLSNFYRSVPPEFPFQVRRIHLPARSSE